EIKKRDGVRPAVASLLWLIPNSIFELARKRIGPHYWDETQFAEHLTAAGFTVLATRRTFLNGASVLVWARRDVEESCMRRTSVGPDALTRGEVLAARAPRHVSIRAPMA